MLTKDPKYSYNMKFSILKFNMAADIRVRLYEESERIWQSIFTTVNNSLIYIDDSIAEILHWSGKALDMTDAGAIRIQSIESGLVSCKLTKLCKA